MYDENYVNFVSNQIMKVKNEINVNCIYDIYDYEAFIPDMLEVSTDDKLVQEFCEGDQTYFFITVLGRVENEFNCICKDDIKEVIRVMLKQL